MDNLPNTLADLFGSGAFAAVIGFLGFTIKALIKNKSTIFDALSAFADHTKSKNDNELIDKVKKLAETAVRYVQPFAVPGTEQNKEATRLLVENAKRFNVDLDSDKAQEYIEEAYQVVYGDSKDELTTKSPSDAQQDLVAEVTAAAAKVDAENPPATHLDNGELIEINGKKYTLGTSDSDTITLTKEGE